MESGSAPIGFEGIFSNPKKTFIGFEQYEVNQKESVVSAYPLDDKMPSVNQPLENNYAHSNNRSCISKPMPSSSHSPKHNTHSHTQGRKSLSYPELFAIHNEIVNEWFKEQWFTFVDNRTETYLTLDCNTNECLTVKTAIDQYQLTSGKTLIRSQPECLLIQTKSKSKTLFIPNSIVSLENLCDNDIARRLRYKLMAIVCHSHETNSKLMFYKDFQSNSWYIYYDQSILSHSHSNILSNKEQYQLESFIRQENHIDLSEFTSPLSALWSHPIVYVYMPEKSNEKK